jgi:23S rRNA pseudouridine2605 synthase
MSSMRVQRALARAGVASRRHAEALILAGRVAVNGRVVSLGEKVDPGRDVLTVDGRRVKPAPRVWIALHKPLGVVVSRADGRGRTTVFELLPKVPGLTYVGRLDVMTSGLLLLTTDGEAAHRLMHPRYRVERTYRVRVHGRPERDIAAALSKPVVIDGRPVELRHWRMRSGAGGSCELLLVLAEGRHRIVRRMCERLGLKVEKLTRLSYGPIRLGRLGPGEWRYLSGNEVRAIGEVIGFRED